MFALSNFASKNIADTMTEIDALFAAIDKQQLYDNIKTEFETVINANDYNSVLRIFNLKNALIPQSKVCELTGVKSKEEFFKLVLTLLKRKDATSILISTEIDNRVIKTAHNIGIATSVA